jgi:transcriptional regulator with XRE-family HTH domain
MTEIEAARKQLGLSQADLAKKLGVNQASVSRFESGELAPNARTLLAVRALLAGIDPGQAAA